MAFAAITTYPRKGAETIQQNLLPVAIIIAIYPREGTETVLLGNFDKSLAVAIYPRKTLSGAARQLSRRESLVQGNGSCKSSPFRGSWHGVSRD